MVGKRCHYEVLLLQELKLPDKSIGGEVETRWHGDFQNTSFLYGGNGAIGDLILLGASGLPQPLFCK